MIPEESALIPGKSIEGCEASCPGVGHPVLRVARV